MPNDRIREAIEPHNAPCPRCSGADDIWLRHSTITIDGFTVTVSTVYHNPCGYAHYEVMVDGELVKTRDKQ